MKKFIKTCIALMVALLLCGIGVALFVQANLGGDTITVIQEGLSETLNISLGSASRIYNIFFLITALLIAREHVGWTTIVNGLLVGYSIDFFNGLLMPLNIYDMNLFIRMICIIIGQIMLIITFSILIKYRNGMNQLDATSYGIEKYTHISYKIIRTGFDILFIVVGWSMGGTVGIGSLFTMATTGYGIDICLKIMNRVLKDD